MQFDMTVLTKKLATSEEVQVVDAKEVWRSLDNTYKYGDWITRRISTSRAKRDIDYGLVLGTSGAKGGRPARDYWVTTDMAKHWAILEQTEKGAQVRQYFIDIERQAREITLVARFTREQVASQLLTHQLYAASLLKVPPHIAQVKAVQEVYKITGVSYRHLLVEGKEQIDVRSDPRKLEAKDIGKHLTRYIAKYTNYHVSSITVNKFLQAIGWHEKDGAYWRATEKGEYHCCVGTWMAKENVEKTGPNLRWDLTAVTKQWEACCGYAWQCLPAYLKKVVPQPKGSWNDALSV